MNKDWSQLNKLMQSNIGRKDSFTSGIATLFELREQLMYALLFFYKELKREDYNAIPFINCNGYHNKTIAYSIWHIFRIEDIVVNTLINNDEQIFFAKGYKSRINSPIITTGNELVKQQIKVFSEQLDLEELYSYALEVKDHTKGVIKALSYNDLKSKIPSIRKQLLISLNVVSYDPNSNWLIDYWCNKDVRGLIKMPLSRHWIMHIEACLRIVHKLYPKFTSNL